jgi:hypothetical protein
MGLWLHVHGPQIQFFWDPTRFFRKKAPKQKGRWKFILNNDHLQKVIARLFGVVKMAESQPVSTQPIALAPLACQIMNVLTDPCPS